jgi:hypothetical protein
MPPMVTNGENANCAMRSKPHKTRMLPDCHTEFIALRNRNNFGGNHERRENTGFA